MKLQRLRIENFKRFRAPLELRDFTAGLNLFAAPNESGKSTVVEAIRAAFLERHRSSSVDHLRPWGDSHSAPMVELDFELGGTHYRLAKSFLNKKRCQLDAAGHPLNGEEAENHLAALLGFGFAGKGISKPENMGIPGLLWIKQGTSHHIADTVSFAQDHLRNALGESLGELASSSGDAVLKTVEAQRNELLTPTNGNPKGDYADVIKRRDGLRAELAQLHADIKAYESRVDRLADERQQYQLSATNRPWVTLRGQLAHFQQQLSAAQGLADKKAAQDRAVLQLAARIAALRAQLADMEREEALLGQRKANLQRAEEQLAAAHSELQHCEPRHAAARQRDTAARLTTRQARQAAERITQTQALAEIDARLTRSSAALDQAQAQQDELSRWQAEALTLAVPPKVLQQLRTDERTLHTIQTKLDAMATTLDFALQADTAVRVAGHITAGRLTVTERTEIDIAGVGRITVLPGGAELEPLGRQRDQLREAVARQLQALAADNLPAVEERVRRHQECQNQAERCTSVLRAVAPQGLAALSAEVVSLNAQREHAQQTLQALAPAPDADHDLPSVADAEAQEASARTASDAATQALHSAQAAISSAQVAMQAATAELAALQTTLSDPARTQRQTQARTDLTDALAQQPTEQAQADALAEQLRTLNLPVLRQDVERLERSASQVEAAHRQREIDIARLEAELAHDGKLGLEEAAADKERELSYAERRCAELARRAQALDHLLQLLRDKRAVLAQRLRAPLQKHLNHYLNILFPGAHIEVGDDLAPGRITRNGVRGPESGEFEELSVGAREQMGVLARLAYADLLKEAGKPTLLILDDALVHTDHARLAQMKRVLYDAAQRHQILVLSCHPEAWTDLGVAARSLS